MKLRYALLISILISCTTDNTSAEQKTVPVHDLHSQPGVKQKVLTSDNIDNYTIDLPIRKSKSYNARLTKKQNKTIVELKKLMQQHALAGDDPWAMAHGLLAIGPEAKISSGEKAVDKLFDFASIKMIENKSFPYFPAKMNVKGKPIMVEPHLHLMAKVLSEIGIAPERRILVDQTEFTIADFYKGVVLSSYLNPYTNTSSYAGSDDIAWSVQAINAILNPGEQWKAENGQVMSVDALSMFLIAVLNKETQSLKRSMEAGANFKKDGQGIFQYTCGGAHVLQGAAYSVARGFGNDEAEEEIQTQIKLMFYRFPRELKIYDQLMKRNPEHKVKLLVQRLKFVGHFLETAQKMAMLNLYEPTEKQIRTMHGALDQLLLITTALKNEGIYQSLYYLKVNDPQLYRDVIGDTCHAVYAMQLFNGDFRSKY